MTETVLSSAAREVVIGFERPFAVIGERINPTGRRRLAEEMAAGDYRRVEADALAQIQAGADLLDVNAGVPLADEPKILRESIERVQSLTDAPLSIDSSIVAALEAGLSAYRGKALVNSVTGEEERLDRAPPRRGRGRGGRGAGAPPPRPPPLVRTNSGYAPSSGELPRYAPVSYRATTRCARRTRPHPLGGRSPAPNACLRRPDPADHPLPAGYPPCSGARPIP